MYLNIMTQQDELNAHIYIINESYLELIVHFELSEDFQGLPFWGEITLVNVRCWSMFIGLQEIGVECWQEYAPLLWQEYSPLLKQGQQVLELC